jgi:hypothetical protein
MAASTVPFTSAGSLLSISAATPATIDAAGYGALSFTEIGFLDNIGEFGAERTLVTFSPIDDINVLKYKGSRNNGSMSLTGAYVPGDAGQILLIAAESADGDYSFCEELQDGTKAYFQAKVMSYKTSVGGVDDMTGISSTVEISGAIVIVYPT